jgi:hypothetical protein
MCKLCLQTEEILHRFHQDVSARLWFCYRSGFPPLGVVRLSSCWAHSNLADGCSCHEFCTVVEQAIVLKHHVFLLRLKRQRSLQLDILATLFVKLDVQHAVRIYVYLYIATQHLACKLWSMSFFCTRSITISKHADVFVLHLEMKVIQMFICWRVRIDHHLLSAIEHQLVFIVLGLQECCELPCSRTCG